MDSMLQIHCAKFIYVVPDGLRELMSDISREVLRSQPEQLYTFIADYLDALMITRENARVAARLIEVISEIGVTIVEFLTRTGLSREEADRITTFIQTAFRKHIKEKEQQKTLAIETVEEESDFIDEVMQEADVPTNIYEEAARIIQRSYRSCRERKEREQDLLYGMVDWRVAARSTIALYRKTGVTYEEANRAATLIKAAYKGYYTRRVMRRLLEQGTKEYMEMMAAEEEKEYAEDKYPMGEEDLKDYDYEMLNRLTENLVEKTETEESSTTALEEDAKIVAEDFVTSVIKYIIPSDITVSQELVDAVGYNFADEEEEYQVMGEMEGEVPPIETTIEVPVEVPTEQIIEAAEKETTEVPAEEGDGPLPEPPIEIPPTVLEEVVPAPEELVPAPEEIVPAPEEAVAAPEEVVLAPDEVVPAPEEVVPVSEEVVLPQEEQPKETDVSATVPDAIKDPEEAGDVAEPKE